MKAAGPGVKQLDFVIGERSRQLGACLRTLEEERSAAGGHPERLVILDPADHPPPEHLEVVGAGDVEHHVPAVRRAIPGRNLPLGGHNPKPPA